MDRLRTIEVFVRVAELGSFTRAARALGMPRASVTAAVQGLEGRLQARLLHRTTRTTVLTADGAVYLEEARRILRELDDLEAGLHGAVRSPRGRLRVDVPAAAGRHVLVPALPEFLARYPELEVELGSGDRPVDLIAEGVDCVIRGGDLHDEALISRRLGALPTITCAAPAYLEARGIPRSPDDLADHVHVGFASPRTRRIFALEFERDGELRTVLPRHHLAVNDADVWIAAAVTGLGIVQAPCGKNVRRHLERGELVRVLAEWPTPALPITVLWPRDRQVVARVRAFVDWAVEVYAVECREAAEAEVATRGVTS
ncbi:MAG: LysR family transcriptional regulator [Nannocystaceae bacterium]